MIVRPVVRKALICCLAACDQITHLFSNWSPMLRDDQDVKDDRGETTGADTPGAQTDARQLHEHGQRAAARPDIR